MRVRTHVSKNEYLRLVKFTYVLDDDDEGLSPFINLFGLLKYGDFTGYLGRFINHYQHHLASHNREDEDDWIMGMIGEYDNEILSFARDTHLNFIIGTMELIEFTFVMMDLLYDAGVNEIYRKPVEDIRIGKYGQTTILFGEDLLQR